MSVIETLKSYLGNDAASDIRVALREDHDRIKALATEMAEARTAAQRIARFEALKPLLTAHARVEERVVYDALVKLRGKAEAHDLGNEGFVEHSLVDVLLERLGKTSLAGTDAWKAHAIVLKEMLEHHIEEEEDEFFDELARHFDAEARASMAAAFLAGKEDMLESAMEADQRAG